MKKLLLLAIMLFVFYSLALAQNIRVKDFYFSEHDLTALQPGAAVIDQNGEKCALIKIITTIKGFTFDVGSLGIMKTDDKHTGEIWVYVPYGIRKITISHPKHGQLRNYPIPVNIEKGRTYVLELEVDEKKVDEIEDKLAELEKRFAEIEKAKSGKSSDEKTPKKPSKPAKQTKEEPKANISPVETRIFKVGDVEFTMVGVAGGKFKMGATPEQGAGESVERPVHQVTLSSFLIGETEVTQALWHAVMGNNPSYIQQDDYPVDQVSWEDCQDFLVKLNSMTGKEFRLPTEAEWEYAARGGQQSKGYKYSGSNNLGDVAWFTMNSDERPHAVRQLQPNELGIYDMSGNVWEWCQDWFSYYEKTPLTNPKGPDAGQYKVIRCGCWTSNRDGCRIAFRYRASSSDCCNYLGFRLALSEQHSL